MGPRIYRGFRASADRVNVRNLIHTKRVKPLLKREVNNETFFTSLRSYYRISLVYVVYILFLVKDGDNIQSFNKHKCLHL